MQGVRQFTKVVSIVFVLCCLGATRTIAQTEQSPTPTSTGHDVVATQDAASQDVRQTQTEKAKQRIKQAVDHIADAKGLIIEGTIDHDRLLSDSLFAVYSGDITVKLSRPDKLFVDYRDGRERFKVWINGDEVIYLDEVAEHFAKVPAAATLEQTAGELFHTYRLIIPLTKLLMADTYGEMMKSGPLISHLGRSRLLGVDVEHIAIHGGQTDIQLWIDSGERPVIRKIVTANRRLPSVPRYSATFTRFEDVESLSDDTFEPELSDRMRETEFFRFGQNQ